MSAAAHVIAMNRPPRLLSPRPPRRLLRTIVGASVDAGRTLISTWLKVAWLLAVAQESLRFMMRVAAAAFPERTLPA